MIVIDTIISFSGAERGTLSSTCRWLLRERRGELRALGIRDPGADPHVHEVILRLLRCDVHRRVGDQTCSRTGWGSGSVCDSVEVR